MRLVFSISVGLILCATTASREVGCNSPTHSRNVAASAIETGPDTFSLPSFSFQRGLSTVSINELIENLGHREFRLREDASKELAKRPGALAVLRRFANDRDAERRQRVRVLVDELSQRNFKRLLASLSNQADMAPLDLLVQLISQNGQRIGRDDRGRVLATIESIRVRVLKDSKTKSLPSGFNKDFLAEQLDVVDLSSMALVESPIVDRGSLVGDRVNLPGCRFSRSAVVAVNTMEVSHCSSCMIVAGASVKLSSCGECILLTNGNIPGDDLNLHKSFVFSGDDIQCQGIFRSVVVATGHVKARTIRESEVIEHAQVSSRITLFSMSSVGLALAPHGEGFLVKKVVPHSPADKSGVVTGDVIMPDSRRWATLQGLEREIRQSFAGDGEATLQVRRGGRQFPVTLFYSGEAGRD